jgi:hypothetical protein
MLINSFYCKDENLVYSFYDGDQGVVHLYISPLEKPDLNPVQVFSSESLIEAKVECDREIYTKAITKLDLKMRR